MVLEVLSGEKTLQQISSKRGIHTKTITYWVEEARKNMASLFQNKVQAEIESQQEEIDQLHRKIGELTIENDFLKKVSGKWKQNSVKKW